MEFNSVQTYDLARILFSVFQYFLYSCMQEKRDAIPFHFKLIRSLTDNFVTNFVVPISNEP